MDACCKRRSGRRGRWRGRKSSGRAGEGRLLPGSEGPLIRPFGAPSPQGERDLVRITPVSATEEDVRLCVFEGGPGRGEVSVKIADGEEAHELAQAREAVRDMIRAEGAEPEDRD
ncbi:MAG: hypothetical protein Dbin4_02727 [Alphaproteobacteria bacterium]|nr:hypothetical protein [Alphaproteobacteria bacterium]